MCVIETCLRCLSGRKEGKGAAPPNQPVKKPGAPSKGKGGREGKGERRVGRRRERKGK